jgi:hypothetical protein
MVALSLIAGQQKCFAQKKTPHKGGVVITEETAN